MPGWQGQKMRLDAFQISPIFTIVVILLLHCYVLFIGSAVALPTRLQTRHFFCNFKASGWIDAISVAADKSANIKFFRFSKNFRDTGFFFGQKIGTKKNLVRFIFRRRPIFLGPRPIFFKNKAWLWTWMRSSSSASASASASVGFRSLPMVRCRPLESLLASQVRKKTKLYLRRSNHCPVKYVERNAFFIVFVPRLYSYWSTTQEYFLSSILFVCYHVPKTKELLKLLLLLFLVFFSICLNSSLK